MTLQCKPGRRLIIKTANNIQPCTMGGFVAFNGKYWGVTAGHALDPFSDGQEVSYFPDSMLGVVGNYAAPSIETDVSDLAKIAVDPAQVSFAPVGYPLPPKLFDEAQLSTLIGKSVLFLGGQIGKTTGRVQAVGQAGHFTRALVVNLDCPTTVPGDSGGPLYLEDGIDLLWLGTLAESRPLPSSTVCECRFVHPAAALSEMGIL
jgi:hypothetical protein